MVYILPNNGMRETQNDILSWYQYTRFSFHAFASSFFSSSYTAFDLYHFFSINMGELKSSHSFHPALAVSNIKTHFPITLEMENVQYANWAELFKVHCRSQREEKLHYHTIVNIEHLSNEIEIQKFKKKDKEIKDEGQQSKQSTIVGTPSSTTSTPRSTERGEIHDHTIINIGQVKDEEKEIEGGIVILTNPEAEFRHMMIIGSSPRRRNHRHMCTEDSPLPIENDDFSHNKRRIRDRIHLLDGNPNDGCGFACSVYAVIIFCIVLLWLLAFRGLGFLLSFLDFCLQLFSGFLCSYLDDL